MEFEENAQPHRLDLFRMSMRRAASSVSLVTARGVEDEYCGMAVTSWASVSMSPPAMLVIVNRSASVHAAISATGRFCLNQMGEAHAPMLERFSRSDMRHLRFDPQDWEEEPDGLPILKGALSSLTCTVETTSNYSTHSIFVGRVDRVILLELAPGRVAPLIWMDGSRASLTTRPPH